MAGSDFSVHSSLRARTNSQAVANRGMSVPSKVAMIEIDGDAGDLQTLAKYHTLIHQDDTSDTGVLVLWAGALVTEAIAHDTIAGIISLRTKGATPVAFSDLTLTDNDAIGVFRQFLTTSSLAAKGIPVAHDTTTSEAEDQTIMSIPANYGLEVALTTAGTDAGTVGGKVLVMVCYVVMPKRITQVQT